MERHATAEVENVTPITAAKGKTAKKDISAA